MERLDIFMHNRTGAKGVNSCCIRYPESAFLFLTAFVHPR